MSDYQPTDRQRAAMPDVVARAARHSVEVPVDLHRWDRVEWQDETRPGRGHAINALHFYEDYFVQLLMDVYGYPSISVCSFEPIHSDSDDDCGCDPCNKERDIDDREARRDDHDLINDDGWEAMKEDRA